MERRKLGDSYDAVKRLWQEVLKKRNAPLYADPQFIQEELRSDYTRLTRVPILNNAPSRPYSILNDPHTGIRLPAEANQDEGLSHIALHTISEQLRRVNVYAVITFDQSNYRKTGVTFKEQRRAKMLSLVGEGWFPFYYASHAPFLFTCRSAQEQQELWQFLIEFGIPENMWELPKRGRTAPL